MATRRLIKLERFGPPGVMSWTDGPLPERGEDDVVVAVEAIGVNFADTMVRRGEYRRDQPLDFTPGFEVAGTVIDGPAEGPEPGGRVLAFTENGGGYADHVVVPRSHVYTVRPEISAVEAAALFVQGVTAWYSVRRYGRVREGDWVLVPAASGGLGAACIQLCVELGARSIGAASTEVKLAVARRHGAVATLLSDPQTLAAGVRDVTAGHGADVVLDAVGGPLFMPCMRALALNGRYVVMGAASQAPSPFDARALLPRGQTIAGVLVARVAELDSSEPQRAWDEVQARYAAGVLRPELTVLGPGDFASAHERIEARTLTGKVVIDLSAAGAD
jgi:NADPH2:quinone reductase